MLADSYCHQHQNYTMNIKHSNDVHAHALTAVGVHDCQQEAMET